VDSFWSNQEFAITLDVTLQEPETASFFTLQDLFLSDITLLLDKI